MFKSRGQASQLESKQLSSYFNLRHLGGDWATTESSSLPFPINTDTQRPKRGRLIGIRTLASLADTGVKMPSKLFVLARNKGILQ